MTDMTAALAPSGAPRKTFLGQPRALFYLAATEVWERFSYYGMTALLVLYMSKQLFLPGHIEHVVGFSQFRGMLEGMFGPMSPIALASEIFGFYTGFVYLTPVLGGIIADRWLGRRNAVVIGAVLMSGGHIAMAFDQSFLLALLLLITGCGLLKGNISTQVGTLYPQTDGEGRTRGFSIFSTAINIGAVAGPLACGALAELYGWHAGFGLAGVLMLAGLATYLAGYREFTEEQAEAKAASAANPAARAEPDAKRSAAIIAALLVVIFVTIFQTIAYNQNLNIALVWIDQHTDLNLFGFNVPVAWFNSIDSFVSIVILAPLFALWRWQGRHGGEPNEMAKIGQGALICAAGNLFLVAAALQPGRTHVLYPILYDVMQGIAFMYYWPTLLALVSEAAPPKVQATMMGLVFCSSAVGDFAIGWLGSFYEKLGPLNFWILHTGIALAGAVLAFALNKPLSRILIQHAAHAKKALA